MYIYLNPRSADFSRGNGNAQPRTDVIASHQTMRKTMAAHGKKVESKRVIQTSYPRFPDTDLISSISIARGLDGEC